MLELRKMTPDEYANYMKSSVEKYAEEKQKGEGLTPENALKMAQDSYQRLLPQGLETPEQFLYSIFSKDSQNSIGILWMAKKMNGVKPYTFIYDIELDAENRGKGLGKDLMQLVEKETLQLGCVSIGLHVYGHNAAAVALYEKSGFETTSRMMKKDLTIP